eukprot:2089055-Prymnesium_polylepis.1
MTKVPSFLPSFLPCLPPHLGQSTRWMRACAAPRRFHTSGLSGTKSKVLDRSKMRAILKRKRKRVRSSSGRSHHQRGDDD